jgi:hypothetical protein
VFLDDAQAQVLAMRLQVAAAQAEAAFHTKGWGKCQEEFSEAGAESVCSINSSSVQDCEVSTAM